MAPDDSKIPALSEEDLELKRNLELYVERSQDPDPEMQKSALENLRREIRVCSMTSVPKPIKFLCPHYGTLKEFHKTMADSYLKEYLSDILSVLAVTMGAEGQRESLTYRLGGSKDDIGSWGHQYIRNLAEEIVQEYAESRYDLEQLLMLVEEIVAFHMNHNAEREAVNFLMEVDETEMLLNYVDPQNFKRICNYLIRAAKYFGTNRDCVLATSYSIYINFEDYQNALRVAAHDNTHIFYEEVFSCADLLDKAQLCYMFARHGVPFIINESMVSDAKVRESLQDIVNNTGLSEGYLTLARNIEVMEAKTPEDIYKGHLLDGRESSGASVDSASQNLAATFVNAFVNAGFGQDKLLTLPSDSTSGFSRNWLFKNKGHCNTSAAASLGMIFLWDVDSGFAQLDKYLHSNDNFVIAGALLGAGIVKCRIKSDPDHVLALLGDYLNNEDTSVQIGAIMGLGIAYAGSKNEQLLHKLSAILRDPKAPLDVIAFSALSLGIIYVGSCEEQVAQSITFALMDRSEADLEEPLTRFLPLGLGFLYLGRWSAVEAAEVSTSDNEKIRNYCDTMLQSCAYAGIGTDRKVQEFLGQCEEHLKGDDINQGSAVLGLAMVAMSEEQGLDVVINSLGRMLQDGEQNIRRAVPLALGLLCLSKPKMNVVDILSELSHDTDSEVAMAAVISLGLISAGTKNERIDRMLGDLSSCYYEDESLLFCVRIAQGLLHMGKGLLTLDPFHSDRFLLSPTALAGIVTFLHACLHTRAILLGKYDYMLYFLVMAMQPRMLLTVDTDLKPLLVPVRVGKADTGFQTLSTPVLLAAGERAELATDKYIPLSPILEGFVILKQNPHHMED